MAVKLKKEVVELINNNNTTKILVTLDKSGETDAVVKDSIKVLEDGSIFYLELLESSRSYKNFTYSLWYNKKITISVIGDKGVNYQLKGTPKKIVISGLVFEKNYKDVREKLGDVDLAAVCIIEPEEVRDETFITRFEEQESRQPVFKHLDRLAK